MMDIYFVCELNNENIRILSKHYSRQDALDSCSYGQFVIEGYEK